MSSPPEYRLIYFPARGRAEMIRFLFAHLGIQYEDIRLPFAEWPAKKPNTPFGTLPVLEVRDNQIASSVGIARYIAEENGLAGSNPLENAEIFAFVDAVEDAWVSIFAALFLEKDETAKVKKVKDLHETYLPFHMGQYEKYAAANKSGWIWGDKVTYADFAVDVLTEYVLRNVKNAKDRFPCLYRHHCKVEQLPAIAEWIKNRPDSIA